MTFAVIVSAVVNVANDAFDRLFAVVAIAVVVHDLYPFRTGKWRRRPVPVRFYFSPSGGVYSFESEILNVIVCT